MELGTIALLLVAGIAGGVANAVAGGASLITFPAMLAAGLPPIAANASNAVAMTPGHLFAAIADRQKLPRFGRQFAELALVALGGGALGATLLLVTPGQVFLGIMPALIGLATLLFAVAPMIQSWLAARRPSRATETVPPPAAGAFALATVYGGYFGAGLGVMMMAILSVTSAEDLRTVNAMKNLLSTVVSAATVAILVVSGIVRWPETLVMFAGAAAGGLIGGGLVKVLPAAWVRAGVIAIGTIVTIVYARRYWF
jgi:uncharacterized membrane protein YfcA